MRRWSKLVGLLLIGALVFALAGCSGGGAQKPEQPKEEAKVRIAYVCAALTTVGSYEIAHYTAFKNMVQKYGFESTLVENLHYGKVPETIRSLASQGCNFFLTNDGGMATPFLEVAGEFPKAWFIITSDMVSTKNMSNVAAFVPNFNELGYLSGVATGLETKTGKIGIVTGEPIRPVGRIIAGWMDGLKSVNPQGKVEVRYTQSWVDNAKSKEASLALLAGGCDILFPCIGSADTGVYEAVREKNARVVGYYTDCHQTDPEHVITSNVVDVERIYDMVGSLISAKQLEAKLYSMGVSSDAIKLAPGRGKLSAETEAKVAEVLADIKNGKISVEQKVYEP